MNVTVKVIATIEEVESVDNFINEMNLSIEDGTGNATIEDTEILGFDIVDSLQ